MFHIRIFRICPANSHEYADFLENRQFLLFICWDSNIYPETGWCCSILKSDCLSSWSINSLEYRLRLSFDEIDRVCDDVLEIDTIESIEEEELRTVDVWIFLEFELEEYICGPWRELEHFRSKPYTSTSHLEPVTFRGNELNFVVFQEGNLLICKNTFQFVSWLMAKKICWHCLVECCCIWVKEIL